MGREEEEEDGRERGLASPDPGTDTEESALLSACACPEGARVRGVIVLSIARIATIDPLPSLVRARAVVVVSLSLSADRPRVSPLLMAEGAGAGAAVAIPCGGVSPPTLTDCGRVSLLLTTEGEGPP